MLIDPLDDSADDDKADATPPVRRWQPGDPFKSHLALAYLRDAFREVNRVWSEAEPESVLELHMAVIDWIAIWCPRDDASAQALRASYEQSIRDLTP